MNNRKTLANNIKHLRTRDRMTQSELARRLDVRQTTISEWEKGNREPDTIEMLKKLCDIFNVTFDEIIDKDLSLHYIPTLNKQNSQFTVLPRRIEEYSLEELQEVQNQIHLFMTEKLRGGNDN